MACEYCLFSRISQLQCRICPQGYRSSAWSTIHREHRYTSILSPRRSIQTLFLNLRDECSVVQRSTSSSAGFHGTHSHQSSQKYHQPYLQVNVDYFKMRRKHSELPRRLPNQCFGGIRIASLFSGCWNGHENSASFEIWSYVVHVANIVVSSPTVDSYIAEHSTIITSFQWTHFSVGKFYPHK
jgi:hypothetical protein